MALRTAGMTCAGPRWIASSCSLTSTRRHLQVLHRLICERATGKCLMDTLDDQFHRLVEVLDTLGHVDEHVGRLDVLDVLGLILVHAGLHQHITALEHRLVHGDFAALDQVDNLIGHGLEVEVEPVVAVRGLALRLPLFCW